MGLWVSDVVIFEAISLFPSGGEFRCTMSCTLLTPTGEAKRSAVRRNEIGSKFFLMSRVTLIA